MIEFLRSLIGEDIRRIIYSVIMFTDFSSLRRLFLYYENNHLLDTGFHEELLNDYFKVKIEYI